MMSEPLVDKRAVVCNYAVPTGPVAAGAKAYIVGAFGGNLPENVEVMVRSRGGRWIRKWERVRKLDRFRWATVPPGHPRYGDVSTSWNGEDLVATLCQCRLEVSEKGRADD